MDSLTEGILAIVASKLDHTPGLVEPIDNLGIDSLAMAEIVFQIETRYEIKTDDRILDVQSISDLVDYVRAKMDDVAQA